MKMRETLGLKIRNRVIFTQFSSVLSRVRLFATSWTAARQAPLSITNSWSLLKLISIESVMPSNHLIHCHPLLPPSNFPSIRVFSSESVLHIRWPEYWSFSLSVSPSNEYSGWIFLRIDWFDLLEHRSKKNCHQSMAQCWEIQLRFSCCIETIASSAFRSWENKRLIGDFA